MMDVVLWVLAAVAYLSIAVTLGVQWSDRLDRKSLFHGEHVGWVYALSMLWPVTIAPGLMYIISKSRHEKDRVERAVAARMHVENSRREERMRQMEFELGLGPDETLDREQERQRHWSYGKSGLGEKVEELRARRRRR